MRFNDERPKKRRRLRRRALIMTPVVLLGLPLLAIALLLLPPVRDGLLGLVLGRTHWKIPGELTIGSARSPEPGTIEFRDVAWFVDGDSLLQLDYALIELDLWRVARRDLVVRRLRAAGSLVDISAISGALGVDPAGQNPVMAKPKREAGSSRSRFPRAGSLADVPSLAVDHIDVSVRRVVWSDSLAIDEVVLQGGVSVLSGESPWVRVDDLRGRFGEGAVDSLYLQADLESGRITATGRGRIGPRAPVNLTVQPAADGGFELRARMGETGGGLAEAAELQLDGTLRRNPLGRLDSAFHGRMYLPRSQVWKTWLPDSASAGRAEFPSMALRLSGSMRIPTPVEADLRVEFESGPWIDSGMVLIQVRDDRVILEKLELAMADLFVSGSGAQGRESMEAHLELRAEGGKFLSRIDDAVTAPDSLTLAARLDANRTGSDWVVTAKVDGGAWLDALGRIGVQVRATADSNSARLAVGIAGRDLLAGTVVRTDLTWLSGSDSAQISSASRSTWKVEVAPIAIRDAGGRTAWSEDELSALVVGPDAGTVAIDLEAKLVAIRELAVVGVLGELHGDATLTQGRPGPFSLRAEWKNPPQPILAELDLSRAQMDSLRTSWRVDGPFTVRARGTVELAAPLASLRLTSDVRLPGPRAIAPLLPDVSPGRLAHMEPLTGTIEAEASPSGRSETLVRVDLASAGWLDRIQAAARLRGTDSGARVELDSVAVAIPGGSLRLTGHLAGEDRALQATLSITEPTLLELFGAGDFSRLGVAATADFRQSAQGSELTGEAVLSTRVGSLDIPEAQTMFEWRRPTAAPTASSDHGVFDAQLDLPQGLTVGDLPLSFVSARLVGDALLSEISVEASGSGEDLSFSIAAGILSDDAVWNAKVNELVVGFAGASLQNENPFDLWIRPEREFEVSGMFLRGNAGELRVDGRLTAATTDLSVHGDLMMPASLAPPDLPPGIWPEHVRFDLSAADADSVRVLVEATGLRLGDHKDLTLRARGVFGDAGAYADLALGSQRALAKQWPVLGAGDKDEPDLDGVSPALPEEILVRGTASAPFRLRRTPFVAAFDSGEVRLDLQIDDVAVPTSRSGRILLANGRLTAHGRASAPRARFHGSVAFQDWKELAGYRAELEVDVSPDSGAIGSVQLFDERHAIVTAGARVPVDLSLRPLAFAPRAGAHATARLDAPSLDLARFKALLPPKYSMSGKLEIRMEANGPAEDPELSGSLRGHELRANLADGTRVIAAAKIDFTGTATRPGVRGRIDVENGVLVIPEQSREILPAEGSAILWEARVRAANGGDSQMGPPDLRSQPRRIEPDLHVNISIPGGFWIRGEGLDVELGGELLVQTEQMVIISGNLKALRGEYRLLGRVFEVEQGTVQFYGEDELNPVLDLSLTTRVEGLLFRVSLFGTVLEPELVLSSEPPMPDGDILSFLVLGRAMEDLDQKQVGLLQSRVTEIAAVFGTTQIEGELEKRLGFDVVSIRQSSGPDQGSALVVGKYISPRFLIKYEQGLDTGSSFFFNLEYLLTRSLRLETLAGQQQSGVEINWTRDY